MGPSRHPVVHNSNDGSCFDRHIPPSIAVIAGTRPEFIKLAPVIQEIRQLLGDNFVRVYSTGQHRSLLQQATNALHVRVDYDFDLMTHAQSASEIQRRVVSASDHAFKEHRPELVIVQGDTVSAFGGAMAAYLNMIPIVHIEAGLRTHNTHNPWPEEGLRQMISRIATWHLAPTTLSRTNLLEEGISADRIHIVGNPGIDSLVNTLKQNSTEPLHIPGLDITKPWVIVTMHRRESLHGALDLFCQSLKSAMAAYPDLQVVWPLHPNPAVKSTVVRHMGHRGQSPILFCDPLPFHQLAPLVSGAQMVITDSGGLQEEAPYSGVPVIIIRDCTERQEVIDLGLGLLAGADGRGLLSSFEHFLNTPVDKKSVKVWQNMQGNGRSSKKIAHHVKSFVSSE
ncbi:non-hydrolyzing UDP-N-acetylglucosamine 2-epimerase [Thalassospira lucentensis]|uniref:non-hydrolyzing UDP-N-acetylglucosamine 2-epimerase n=1 Tax=Thalassospira lucentensis TaxID=168935 RepID=UPI003D2F2B60